MRLLFRAYLEVNVVSVFNQLDGECLRRLRKCGLILAEWIQSSDVAPRRGGIGFSLSFLVP